MSNKYKKWYDNIIKKSRERLKPDKDYPGCKGVSGYECHHIKPQCLGGDDNRENIAYLKFREHFICHLLLTKIYPNSLKLKQAFSVMIHLHGVKINSKIYERNKEEIRKLNSGFNSPRSNLQIWFREDLYYTEWLKSGKISPLRFSNYLNERYKTNYSNHQFTRMIEGFIRKHKGEIKTLYGRMYSDEIVKNYHRLKGLWVINTYPCQGEFDEIIQRDLGLKINSGRLIVEFSKDFNKPLRNKTMPPWIYLNEKTLYEIWANEELSKRKLTKEINQRFNKTFTVALIYGLIKRWKRGVWVSQYPTSK